MKGSRERQPSARPNILLFVAVMSETPPFGLVVRVSFEPQFQESLFLAFSVIDVKYE